MTEKFLLTAKAGDEMAGLRLDQAAAQLFPAYSRARLQGWIKHSQLLVNEHPGKASDKLVGGESLSLRAEVETPEHWQAERLALDIVHEDEALLVLNKPVGLVVHPAVGNRSGTLLNALLYHCPALDKVPRAGIVHRLDKDTSGLMVVAKTLSSHLSLVEQLQARTINREYQAVVNGLIVAGGSIDAPLGRHPVQRTRRAIVAGNEGKPAVTHYRVRERFRSHTFVNVRLETGRTHQIRVHMAHIGYPLVGDQTYGGRLKFPRGASLELIEFLKTFKRQALHAFRLGLLHPDSGLAMSWEVDTPADMQALVDVLRRDRE
ncbi:MAG: 23S rRNA pseudouridine(1911/1915/1917) synthase RluD [Pseudomonadales bacterium]|nr:23S rRNA pseudouridine(1911/1915/1917) synthase RluD [Pseudomonadales bacterium]